MLRSCRSKLKSVQPVYLMHYRLTLQSVHAGGSGQLFLVSGYTLPYQSANRDLSKKQWQESGGLSRAITALGLRHQGGRGIFLTLLVSPSPAVSNVADPYLKGDAVLSDGGTIPASYHLKLSDSDLIFYQRRTLHYGCKYRQ